MVIFYVYLKRRYAVLNNVNLYILCKLFGFSMLGFRRAERFTYMKKTGEQNLLSPPTTFFGGTD